MPLIIREDSEKLTKRQIIIPDEVADKLRQNMNLYANDKTSDGYKRLRSLTDKDYNKRSDGKETQHNDKMTVSFADARRIDHDFKSLKQNPNSKEFNMLGGFDTYNAIKNGLKQARTSVKQNNPVPPVPKIDKHPAKTPEVKDDFKMGNANITVKEIYITDKQAEYLTEYYNQLKIPFNNPSKPYDPKANYELLIDYLEKIGRYGTLPPSNSKIKNCVSIPKEHILNATKREDIINNYVGYLISNTLNDFIEEYKDNLEYFKDQDVVNNSYNYEYDSFDQIHEEVLTDEALPIFKEMLSANMYCDLFYNMHITYNERGLIYIERMITAPNVMSDGNVSVGYDNPQAYKDYYQYLTTQLNGVGVCWTYRKGGSDAYCGEHFPNSSVIIFKGFVDSNDVEWNDTVELNLAMPDEYELRLKEGANVEIDEVIIDDGKKLPLKSPIIVQA